MAPEVARITLILTLGTLILPKDALTASAEPVESAFKTMLIVWISPSFLRLNKSSKVAAEVAFFSLASQLEALHSNL